MATESEYRRQMIGILTQYLARADGVWDQVVDINIDEVMPLGPQESAYVTAEMTKAGTGAAMVIVQLLDYLAADGKTDRAAWLRRAAADAEAMWG